MDVVSMMRREVARWCRDRADGRPPKRIVLSIELAAELDDVLLDRCEAFGGNIKDFVPDDIEYGAVAYFMGVPVVADLPRSDMAFLE